MPIDLWVRGISAIKPGVPGLSETIRVRSILGRFLEHSRVYSFGTDTDPDETGEVWLGSPDMMHRNLDRRVEVIVRVGDTGHCRELRQLMDLGMDDGTASWWLDGEGTWTRHNLAPDGERLRDIQFGLIRARLAAVVSQASAVRRWLTTAASRALTRCPCSRRSRPRA